MGNERLTIQRFEKMLMELLQRHASYQKQIAQLTQENAALKRLLREAKANLSVSNELDTHLKKVLRSGHDGALMQQINAYIKEIDACLAYFEQI